MNQLPRKNPVSIQTLDYASPSAPRIVKKNYDLRRTIGLTVNSIGLILGLLLSIAMLQAADGWTLLVLIPVNICFFILQLMASVFGVATGLSDDLSRYETRRMRLLLILSGIAFLVAAANLYRLS